MTKRFAAPVACATTALVLLAACSDDDEDSSSTTEQTSTTEATADGATKLATGEDVELVGADDLGGQTLNIDATQDGDQVTGELRFTDPSGEVVVAVECADTDTDGVVILGGTVTESTDDEISGLVALFIKEGDPDRVAVWLDAGENPTCTDLLANRHDVLDDDSAFFEVEEGSDIDTAN